MKLNGNMYFIFRVFGSDVAMIGMNAPLPEAQETKSSFYLEIH